MPEPIGGFFAKLSLLTDEAAFRRGIGYLNQIRTVLGALALVKVAEGAVRFVEKLAAINEQQALMVTTAAEIGDSTDTLKAWGYTIEMVGGKTDDFVSHLKSLIETVADLGRGITPDNQKFIDMFGVLGIKEGEWMGQSPAQLAQKMLDNAAQAVARYRQMPGMYGVQQEVKVRDAIRNMLGESANYALTYMLERHLNAAQLLQQGRLPIMTTQEQQRGALGPMADWNTLRNIWTEMGAEFSMDFFKALDPGLKDFVGKYAQNKDNIRQTIKELADALGRLGAAILNLVESPGFAKFIDYLEKTVDTMAKAADVFGGRRSIWEGTQWPWTSEYWTNSWPSFVPQPQQIGDWVRERWGKLVVTVENKTGLPLKASATVEDSTQKVLQMPSGGAH
jgi:hypothetical protein